MPLMGVAESQSATPSLQSRSATDCTGLKLPLAMNAWLAALLINIAASYEAASR
jgi:hypothetical protein